MYKIAFVTPSNHFNDMLLSIFEEHDRYALEMGDTNAGTYACEVYNIDKTVDILKYELDADVLIARGYMARQLMAHPSGIPVIEMPIVSNELLVALDKSRKQYGNMKVGAIGLDNMILDVDKIGEILGVPAKAYLRKSTEALAASQSVDQALADGCEVIVSGFNTCEYARSIGLNTIEIESGRQSIWQAITEAKRAVNIIRNERKRALRTKAILDYVHEGVIALDTDGSVTMINDQAGKLLGLRPSAAIGQSISRVIVDSPFKKAVISDDLQINEVMPYLQIQLSVNKVPLIDHGEAAGNIITFQDIAMIQETEGKIRNQLYSTGHVARFTFDDILGSSQKFRNAIDFARRFSMVNSNILITGETGTGKELFAQSIHNASNRRSGPFVAINCAALPENLLESELFGYVEGAFTGAAKTGKPGLFELAHKGTIFLDEISDLPQKLQGRLLRVLQERSIMRLGHDKVISIDVRIVAATNRDLSQLATSGEFRQDLYFRLNVLTLEIPPLRARIGDIQELAQLFVKQYAALFNRSRMTFSDDAVACLEQMEWIGNVRELQNVCERLVVLTDRSEITRTDILAATQFHVSPAGQSEGQSQSVRSGKTDYESNRTDRLKTELTEFEFNRISDALRRFSGDRDLAAKYLGLSRTTFWRRLKELNIDQSDFSK